MCECKFGSFLLYAYWFSSIAQMCDDEQHIYNSNKAAASVLLDMSKRQAS